MSWLHPAFHASYMNQSCLIYEWVMFHTWMSHVSYMNESCFIREWVMSHIWMSRVSHVNESCFMSKWVMSHSRMSRVSYMNDSCFICEWAVIEPCHTHMWHESSLTCENKQIQYGCQKAALKSSWKTAGVEPGPQKVPGWEDLWRVLVLIQMHRFVRNIGTN